MAISAQKRNNVHIKGNEEASKTIVFGHGFGTDQHSFKAITPAFEEAYKIVLYDNVGAGMADSEAYHVERYHNLQAFSSDLEQLLDEYQLRDVIFVGHSASGMIGLLTAIRRPELFDRLVLLAASPRYLNDTYDGYTGGFDQPTLDNLYASMSNSYQAWASGFASMVAANPGQPEFARSFAATLQSLRPDVALMVARTIFQSDYRRELSQLDKPTLIIQSREDIAVPMEVADYLHTHIKNSRLAVVNATGHLPHVSAPQEVIDVIKSFI